MPRARVLTLMAGAAAALAMDPDTVRGAEAAAAKTCTTLVDKNAPLYAALSLLKLGGSEQDLSSEEMMAPVDAAFPWLSKCIGSADILAVGMSALSDPALTKCLGLAMSASSSSASASNGTNATGAQDLNALMSGDSFGSTICPLLNATIMPCLDTIYMKTLPALMDSGGSCCDDMQTEMKKALGDKPEETMKCMTRRVGDMVCAVKTYKDGSTGESKNVTCGQVWVDALSGGAVMGDLLKMTQIPNNQACAAMAGETFTTSSGDAYQLFKNATPIDSCFAPVNLMLTDMSKMPLIAEVQLTDLFADGKCLKGQTVVDWMKQPNSTVMIMADAIDKMLKTSMPNLVASNASSSDNVTVTVEAGLEEMEPQLSKLCFHLPNSVSGCKYTSGVKFVYFTDASPTQPQSPIPAPSPVSAATMPSSFAWLSSSLALAVVLALA